MPVKQFCANLYTTTYKRVQNRLTNEYLAKPRTRGILSEKKRDEIERDAQKEAIKNAIVKGIKKFPTNEAAEIHRAVYETHLRKKSGIRDPETIAKAISAEQSWRKSSGHAFEEMIKLQASKAFSGHNIEIILQRDLSKLINKNELHNLPPDISWLREQIKANKFDLYAILKQGEQRHCYGCIQAKTSIRDRVTRDREPSMQAMVSLFWSTVIVLDGDFLRMPTFKSMVNGGTTEHPDNGWHGMYVFSEQYTEDRIYPTDLELKNFKEHAIEAAEYWLTQRHWFKSNWRATTS
jgi:hypothetical protein